MPVAGIARVGHEDLVARVDQRQAGQLQRGRVGGEGLQRGGLGRMEEAPGQGQRLIKRLVEHATVGQLSQRVVL